MKSSNAGIALLMGMALFVLAEVTGQTVRRPGSARNNAAKKKATQENPPARPRDPRLVEMHREFLAKTERLAAEYEGRGELDKAREVYEAILRLMPKYDKAEAALGRIVGQQATKDRKLLKVSAKKDWQDSGVILQAGKPVHIQSDGAWQMTMITSPDGIEIPKEYRDFKLGALVGIINTGGDPAEMKPFLIGSQLDFVAPQSGRLFLRIYDADTRDNAGELSVMIQSTFGR